MITPLIRTTLAALLLVATSAQSQVRYIYSTAGDEVTDTRTGLIWRRCSEGQAWSGSTCTGTAATYSHELALARATAQAGTVGWRLPNVKELASITDKTRNNPAIDTTAFPATPSNIYCSSTPMADNASYAFCIDFSDGDFIGGYRGGNHHVRLVR